MSKLGRFFSASYIGRVLQAAVDKARGKGFHVRSSKWPGVRAKHLKEEPVCQWCTGGEKLQVHHQIPFHEQPDLELTDSNLITLCEVKPSKCHLEKGHLGNYKSFNPNIRRDCNAKKNQIEESKIV
jgi:5-methylcytosine-specific restriction endonuclease McrA